MNRLVYLAAEKCSLQYSKEIKYSNSKKNIFLKRSLVSKKSLHVSATLFMSLMLPTKIEWLSVVQAISRTQGAPGCVGWIASCYCPLEVQNIQLAADKKQ